ncbi:plant/MEB5-like protein [Sesbania bispinosa]|nr:plant/MEB5-like protein [Sesbania bispinosa]
MHPERSPIPEPRADTHHRSASTGSSLKALMSSNDSYAQYNAKIDCDMNSKHDLPVVVDKHLDVGEDEGWITIPCKELLEKWNHVPDIQSLCSLDRSFLFPGEQAHILACLSACKQDTQVTPFKVAVLTDKNGINHNPDEENGNIERNNSVFGEGELSTSGEEKLADISDEALHKKNSNSSETNSQKASAIKTKETALSSTSAVIDRGNFDATLSGGMARNSAKCFGLPNGDIVVYAIKLRKL